MEGDAMVRAIKEQVTIQPGGLIEIRRPELPSGAVAEVIVMVDEQEISGRKPKKFSDFFGSVRGCFESGEAADAFIRAERDSWSR